MASAAQQHHLPTKNPLLPAGVSYLVPPPPYEACTLTDKLLVYASSLVIVGSPLWFYGGILWLHRRWRTYRLLAEGHRDRSADGARGDAEGSDVEAERRERRSRYRELAGRCLAALAAVVVLSALGPHRHPKVGSALGVRRWRLWDAWMRYVGFTVLRDDGDSQPTNDATKEFDIKSSPAIFAFVPHGLFPFGLAFSCLPSEGYENTWGPFRPVAATATKLFPLVRTLLSWMDGVDASRSSVAEALAEPTSRRRIGISPGGIAEMFESYPKPGYHRDDEAALLRDRRGMFRLASEHNLPVVPVYVFGATKMFKRLQLPRFLETLSRAFKISLCILFGKSGLPVPFRQRLAYVVGRTVFPPGGDCAAASEEELGRRAEEMHDAFCEEIKRIFERNKEWYGWGRKSLRIV